MELKGKWACPEFYDSQINITEDGRVSCEFADIGEYGVTTGIYHRRRQDKAFRVRLGV